MPIVYLIVRQTRPLSKPALAPRGAEHRFSNTPSTYMHKPGFLYSSISFSPAPYTRTLTFTFEAAPTSASDSISAVYAGENIDDALAQVNREVDAAMTQARDSALAYTHVWMRCEQGFCMVRTAVDVQGRREGVTWELCVWPVDEGWFEGGVKRE